MRSLLVTVVFLINTAPAIAATPWEEYLALPSSANAALVTTMTYSPGNVPHGGDSPSDIRVLEDQVLAQDREAFRLLVRLYRSTDGGLAEDLGVFPGHSVRVHPEFFLHEVAALNRPCSELAWALNAPGLQYVDRPAARRYEIDARKAALEDLVPAGHFSECAVSVSKSLPQNRGLGSRLNRNTDAAIVYTLNR